MKIQIIEDIRRVIVPYEQLLEGLELTRELGYTELVITISPLDNMWEKTKVNLDKVVDYKSIEHIGIFDTEKKAQYPINLNILSQLPLLESFTLDISGDCIVDFSVFNRLKKIDLSWRQSFENFSSLKTLTELRISGYNKKTMEDFKEMTSLRKMILWDPIIKDLTGIEQCVSLNYADIFRAKKLLSLESIIHLDSLAYLHILSCPKLSDTSEIFALKNLRVLKIGKCRGIKELLPVKYSGVETLQLDSINNLHFISKMPKLKQLLFEDVVDGDLSPLLNHPTLSYLHFPNKKKYSHTRSEIISTLSSCQI